MPTDPRINCAADICCGPPPPLAAKARQLCYDIEALPPSPEATDLSAAASALHHSLAAREPEGFNAEAHRARVGILLDLGVGEEVAARVSRAMVAKGLCFMPQALANVIREIAFPAGGSS